ncbi:LysR family transcriptional regulator [Pararobbsia alpina]|uniref:LysR family transcriptional regulator n=1 Tax=Pararobbsia alpina TaxID=621374 RepID=UPI0039A595AE
MNFTHLAAFLAVADTGSVTAASERLHVSQPALTREIRELEERMGVPLFDRMPRGMQATEAGRLLADYAKQIFALADAAENAVGEFAGLARGQLGVAASRTIGEHLLPGVLSEFRRRYPGVVVDVAVSNTERVEHTVLAQERQIGLIEGPFDHETFDAVVVGHDELIAVAAPSHALARKRRLSAEEIGKAELVMREAGSGTRKVVEEAYASHKIALEPKLSLGSSEGIKRVLYLGESVSWVSRHAVADDLAARKLVELQVADLKIERDLNMIWRKARGLSPSARAFKALVEDRFRAT